MISPGLRKFFRSLWLDIGHGPTPKIGRNDLTLSQWSIWIVALFFSNKDAETLIRFQFSGDFWCTAISSSCRVSQVLSFMSLLSNMKLINKDQRSNLGNEDEEKQLGLSTVKKRKKRIKEITMVLKKLK